MARKTDDKKLENIYNKVQEYPGRKPGFIARLLGLNRLEKNLANQFRYLEK
jgi:hypothetical protein